MFFPRTRRAWLIRLSIPVLLFAGLYVYSLQFTPEAEDLPGQRALLAQRPAPEPVITVDRSQLLADVQALAAPAMQGRGVGTPGGALAREYLRARFTAVGLEPLGGTGFERAFSFTPSRGIRFWRSKFWQTPQPIRGVNLVGQIRGSTDPDNVLVITAHYDHLGVREGRTYFGADDNASGVAALLAVASHFRAHPPRHSLVFVAFDGEEKGLRGAKAFLADPPLPLSSIRVNINFDMLSRSKVNEIVLSGLFANPQLKPLLDPVRLRVAPVILFGHDHPRPFWNMDDWTQQSDQGEFHHRGIPFVYLGVQDHPDYHQPTDTFERIDADFFTGVAGAAVAIVAALDAAESGRLHRP